jgi:hypothetical protein
MWRILLLIPLIIGCPAKDRNPKPQRVETCRKLYEQCKLPNGPLGVCSESACEPGQRPPCMACVSQH